MKVLLNFLLFQIGWFACVLSAANGVAWAGCLVALAIVALHLYTAADLRGEMQLLALALALGLLVDSLLVMSGWVRYPTGNWLPGFAPYWILVMWLLFATTLTTSLRWLRGRYLLATLLGAAGGPLSYFAGQELGAISMSSPQQALAALGVAWALALPFLTYMAFRPQRGGTPEFILEDWKESGNA